MMRSETNRHGNQEEPAADPPQRRRKNMERVHGTLHRIHQMPHGLKAKRQRHGRRNDTNATTPFPFPRHTRRCILNQFTPKAGTPCRFFFETLTFSFYVLIITKVSYDLTSVKR